MARKKNSTPKTGRSAKQIRNEAIRKEKEAAEQFAREQAAKFPGLVREETPDPLAYVPIALDRLPRDKAAREILKEAGYSAWRDIFTDWDAVRSDNVGKDFRQNFYSTPAELVKAYSNAIPLGIVHILYDYVNDVYHAILSGSH